MHMRTIVFVSGFLILVGAGNMLATKGTGLPLVIIIIDGLRHDDLYLFNKYQVLKNFVTSGFVCKLTSPLIIEDITDIGPMVLLASKKPKPLLWEVYSRLRFGAQLVVVRLTKLDLKGLDKNIKQVIHDLKDVGANPATFILVGAEHPGFIVLHPKQPAANEWYKEQKSSFINDIISMHSSDHYKVRTTQALIVYVDDLSFSDVKRFDMYKTLDMLFESGYTVKIRGRVSPQFFLKLTNSTIYGDHADSVLPELAERVIGGKRVTFGRIKTKYLECLDFHLERLIFNLKEINAFRYTQIYVIGAGGKGQGILMMHLPDVKNMLPFGFNGTFTAAQVQHNIRENIDQLEEILRRRLLVLGFPDSYDDMVYKFEEFRGTRAYFYMGIHGSTQNHTNIDSVINFRPNAPFWIYNQTGCINYGKCCRYPANKCLQRTGNHGIEKAIMLLMSGNNLVLMNHMENRLDMITDILELLKEYLDDFRLADTTNIMILGGRGPGGFVLFAGPDVKGRTKLKLTVGPRDIHILITKLMRLKSQFSWMDRLLKL